MRRLLFVLPVLAFLLIAGGLAMGLGRDPSILPSTLIDKPLPAFALSDVRGKAGGRSLASTDFRGEPMLLNIFASWCVSCRIEHPFLMQLSRDGVPLHGLNWKDKGDDGARWLAELGDPYARVGYDPTGRTGIDLGVTGAPETFVIDGQGRVRYRHVGPVTPKVWTETLEPLMTRLRAET